MVFRLARGCAAFGLFLFVVTAPLAAAPRAGSGIDPTLLAGMKARAIGPAGMSGRIAAVEGVASDPNVFYVGAATGGLWKSVDGALTWTPIFDDQPVHAIGAIAVNQQNPDIVWVGTGEGNLRNSVSFGNGVYKSLDAGRTWQYLGLPASERIRRIVLDPTDPDVAYVAALGRLWGDSPERGLYKTTDGGATWKLILPGDASTGCTDVAMDPRNPNKLFAAMYTFRRGPAFFSSGSYQSGLFVTVDAGATWKEITPEDGLPDGKLGRIGLAIAPSDPRVVYAIVEAKENGFYRSTDGGVTWKNTGAKRMFGDRPFYYAEIRVDPNYPDRVYSLWSLVSVSEDGGQNWRVLIPWSQLHPDHHAMWIHPTDGNILIEGNDGGVGLSTDRGETWRFAPNLPVAQYYHINVDMDQPYNVYGGLQDNGSWRGPNTVWENGGIRNHHWEEVGFGDGFDTSPYPKDSMQGYSMSQEGYLIWWDLHNGERRSIRPAPEPGDTLRFNWNAAFAQDPFDFDTIYLGSQYLHKSTDRGETWTRISPDLTTDSPERQKQNESGGLTPDVTGAENNTTITAISLSPKDRGVIWVGTDDGRVHVTRDGGRNWTSLEDRAKGVPAGSWVPKIDASPFDAGTAFVVFDDHRRSNFEPYAFRVTDYGSTWTRLATPDVRGYALALIQDPVKPELLFLGTEFGLYVSLDAGGSWIHWTAGVPTCSVMDLVVHPRDYDLVMGTHGRGVIILDDIRPLRSLNAQVAAEKLHLFEIPPAQQYVEKQTGASRFPGASEFRGETEPYGALVSFWVTDAKLPLPDEKLERERKAKERAEKEAKEESGKTEKPEAKPAGGPPGGGHPGMGPWGGGDKGPKVTITVADASGKRVRRFTRPVTQGMNRIVWNLGSDPFKAPGRSEEEWWEDESTGPQVLPGSYTLTLKLGDDEVSGKVTVLPDPRTAIATADRQAAWDAYQRAGKLQETVSEALKRLDTTKGDLDFITGKLRDLKKERDKAKDDDDEEEAAPPDTSSADPLNALQKDAEKLQKTIGDFDKRLRRQRGAKGIPGGSNLLGDIRESMMYIGSTWERPSPTVLQYLDRAEGELKTFLDDFNRFYDEDVKAFREKTKTVELPLLEEKEGLGVEP